MKRSDTLTNSIVIGDEGERRESTGSSYLPYVYLIGGGLSVSML